MIPNWNTRLASIIQRLRMDVLADTTDKAQYRREAALATGGLPVYTDLGGSFVIAPTGQVLHHGLDDHIVSNVKEAKWQRFARVIAGNQYPELREIMPVRPDVALNCHLCNGTGKSHDTYCGECGATGWIE